MKSLRRFSALASALIVAAAAAAVAGAATATAATQQAVIAFEPLAGNATYLVYVQNSGSCKNPDLSLHVRDIDGATRTLNLQGYARDDLDGGECNVVGPWSLAGNTLSAQFVDRQSGGYQVFWWDLAEHRHGQVSEPSSLQGNYVGSLPGGWIYSENSVVNTYSTALYREGTGGKVSSYGTFNRFNQVVAGARGLVLINDNGAHSGVRYLEYGAAKPVQLAHPVRNNQSTYCTAVTATYLACESDSVDDDLSVTKFTEGITGLNGSATRTCSSCWGNDGNIPYSTATPTGITGVLPDGTLRTLRPDGTTVSGRSHGIADVGHLSLYTAYGKLIVRHVSGSITEQSTVTSPQKLLLRG